MSDMGRELNYLLGQASSATGVAWDSLTNQENLQNRLDEVNDFIKKALGSKNIFTKS